MASTSSSLVEEKKYGTAKKNSTYYKKSMTGRRKRTPFAVAILIVFAVCQVTTPYIVMNSQHRRCPTIFQDAVSDGVAALS
ncbi:hypothetical protein Pcinc_018385 [Petrolisthes cinctipes]|uniref:Transmembrane protein n=1 Tax=Petrolisthes cinctipes TaxID=88211 RepID=A0AAE1FM92_PETCI|nr:hypothetical protein Pcinc_018385 [Petrolisthes cinctipes]